MDQNTIAHLEMLARIKLTPGQRERLAVELGRIVEYASRLQAIDTDGAVSERGAGADELSPVTSTVDPFSSGLRADVPGECVARDVVIDGAPDTDGRKELFRVRRVIHK
jgi:aspartyl/glutamyl-tRNA(Asn/Gln) amidotransferase C subunit